MKDLTTGLQENLSALVDDKKVFGASFSIKRNDFYWSGAAGNMDVDRQYFIASTTKLFTTAIILHLRAGGKLDLDDRISLYLDESIVKGLHIYKGRDYSEYLTIRHLLSHTSGLPDYFQNKGSNGKSLEEELLAANDQRWTFEEAIEKARSMKSLFHPGRKGKAYYSDTNYQLLGKIIENRTGNSYSKACDEIIIRPLQLKNTYLYRDPSDRRPMPMYYKSKQLDISGAMSSFAADGSIVSTSPEMLLFIEAFFSGRFFPESYVEELKEWNRIFFPMQSGVGIHKFKLPWIFNPFGAVPVFIGHSGLSGALAFYSPGKKLFIAGTVNQIAYTDLSFRTMIRLAGKVLKN